MTHVLSTHTVHPQRTRGAHTVHAWHALRTMCTCAIRSQGLPLFFMQPLATQYFAMRTVCAPCVHRACVVCVCVLSVPERAPSSGERKTSDFPSRLHNYFEASSLFAGSCSRALPAMADQISAHCHRRISKTLCKSNMKSEQKKEKIRSARN